MPAFTHFIFDLDGTLVDTKDDLAAATNFVLVRLGLPTVPPQTVYSYVGYGARALVERVLGKPHTHLLAEGLVLFLDYYREHLLDHTQPYPGMVPILEEIKDGGGVLSLLTNKPEELSRRILAGLGLSGYFTGIVGGDTLATRKPDPQGVYYLQNLCAVPLEKTLLIGDSAVDVETGRAAGVAVCGVTWGFAVADLTAGLGRSARAASQSGPGERSSEFLVHTPAELLALVTE